MNTTTPNNDGQSKISPDLYARVQTQNTTSNYGTSHYFNTDPDQWHIFYVGNRPGFSSEKPAELFGPKREPGGQNSPGASISS